MKGITDRWGGAVDVHRNRKIDGPGLMIQCELNKADRADSKRGRNYYCLHLTPANARKLATEITSVVAGGGKI